MGSNFWDKFSKGAAVAGTVVGGTAVVANVANKLINSNVNRRKQKVEMEIMQQDAYLRQQQALLDQEVKLKQLQLQEHQINVGANRDITLSQIEANRDMNIQNMKSQASIQNTYMSSTADVQKAQAMYAENSALANHNGMVYDQNNGFAMDSRNMNYYGMYPGNMGMMVAGSMYPMQPNNQNMNMNQLQQKLLEAKSMYDRGIIDEKEFDQLRNNLLGSVK